MASSLSVVNPTSFGQLLSRTFFPPRPLSTATSVVSFHCLFSSSSTVTMTSKTNMKSISSQTNTTIAAYNAHSLQVAIFKTLTINIGNELNNGIFAPSTRRAFFKIMSNIFLISSKKIPFEQYYRLHVSGPTIAICETKASNVFVLAHASFDQNHFFPTCSTRSYRRFQRFSWVWLLSKTGTV